MDDADKNDPESRLALVLLRASRLWNQAELARAARIAPSQLSVYERGERATPRDVLERAAEAAGFPVYLLDPLLWTLRSFRAAARGKFRLDRVLAAALTAEMIALAQEAVDLILAPLAQPSGLETVDAAELWALLEGCTAAERRMLVEDLEEYWNGELCERVAAESLRKAPDDPREALELAELALFIAERLPEEETGRRRLQGYSWAHVGHARRAQGDEAGAREAFDRARRLWEGAPQGETGLAEEARKLGLESDLGVKGESQPETCAGRDLNL
jgi:transcriptional regulator with XRE-family HTH domain